MMSRENDIVKEYKDIKDDYNYDPSIFNAEDDRARKVKYIINNKLTLVDKTIILLYAEYKSYRKLGKKMGLSHMTLRKEVLRIREQILNEYNKL